ncbi:MAG TPA: serine hydrolase [Steroidobacteraceae bacterium]|nr:serine hydrolase [Steroidobacteraceae bacterium]
MNLKGLIAAMAAAASFASAARGAPPQGFERRVEQVRSAIGVPGMAIAIVENDQVTFARGFGVRALGEAARVDADTIFPTGSTGKAFTVADLAVLVDAGRIGWDDRVTDRLPGFEMYDPWVTREITIRDLLVHRSGLGLGEGDLMFVPRSNLTRAEAVHRLRYLKPATSFRYGFAYDNVLYMVAGQLIEAVTGESWEKFTTAHVLQAAGMLHSTADEPERFANANRAYPHARLDGGLRGAGTQQRLNEREELGRAAAPAGGLTVSANDMARWLMIQLDAGELPGHSGRLFSQAAHEQMWKPVVLQPVGEPPAALKATQPNFNTYALGWDVTDYAGTKIVWHGGAVLGFLTAVVLIPEKHVGFSIEINCEDGEIIRGLMYELLDHYLGRPHVDWVARYRAEKQRRIDAALAALRTAVAKPAAVGPSLPIAAYAGTYRDPWYGNIEVAVKDGRLGIDFKTTPRMSGTLEHYQYDTFTTHLEDPTIEPAYVTFSLDADGKVDRVTMKPVSPIADFSYDYQDLLFTPLREPRP